MELGPIVDWFRDAGIFVLNGFLYLVYLTWEHAPTLLSLALAALVMAWPDRSIQDVAGHRPRRRDRGTVQQAAPLAMIATAIVATCWTATSLISSNPIPLWGLVMWAGLLLGSLAMPQEQENVLWTHKGLILGYAALAIGLHLIFHAPVDTAAWSELMGVEEGGGQLLDMVRDALAPWALITVWAIYPAAYVALLGQRLFVNRTRLVSPLQSARQTIEALRTRGEA